MTKTKCVIQTFADGFVRGARREATSEPAAGLSPQMAVTSILLYLSTSTLLTSPEAPHAI